MKEEKKSPIKEGDIARQPGQYLKYQLSEVIDKMMGWFMVASFAVVVSSLDWFFYILELPRNPWVPTTLTILLVFFVLWKLGRLRITAKHYYQGYEGEVFVGQLLEGLRPKGYIPLHDVPCDENGKKFNIDHVLVGPKGLFVIETKTWSKKEGNINKIDFSEGRLLKNGIPVGIKEINQSVRNARWLSDLLSKRMGESVDVFSILTFPNWWIEASATMSIKEKYSVLLLSPKAIGGYLENYPDIYNAEQVQRFVAVISAYIHEEASREK